MSEEEYILEISRYTRLVELGSGAFGKVIKVQDKETKKMYAAKISQEVINLESDEMLYLAREINYNASISHPTIIKFIGYSLNDFDHKPYPVIIMEYATNGSLLDIINKERCLSAPIEWNDTKKLIIIYGIASGMKYLHSHNILHRDLKPENILIDDKLFPKISDLGLSRQIHEREESMSLQSSRQVKGTFKYIPLESFTSQEQTKSGDVYAFAMIIYELLTLKIPFRDCNQFEIYHQLLNGHHPDLNVPIVNAYKNLIRRCWSNDIDERPTFEDIVIDLESNPNYITESIDKEAFRDYINFINESSNNYNEKRLIKLDRFKSIDINQQESSFFPFLSRLFKKENFYPEKEFEKLDESHKIFVLNAQKDHTKHFLIGKSLIEGENGFPMNVELGIKYLEKSISEKNIESTFYLSNLLFKGEIIEQDLKKAKKYLSKHLGANDLRIN